MTSSLTRFKKPCPSINDNKKIEENDDLPQDDEHSMPHDNPASWHHHYDGVSAKLLLVTTMRNQVHCFVPMMSFARRLVSVKKREILSRIFVFNRCATDSHAESTSGENNNKNESDVLS